MLYIVYNNLINNQKSVYSTYFSLGRKQTRPVTNGCLCHCTTMRWKMKPTCAVTINQLCCSELTFLIPEWSTAADLISLLFYLLPFLLDFLSFRKVKIIKWSTLVKTVFPIRHHQLKIALLHHHIVKIKQGCFWNHSLLPNPSVTTKDCTTSTSLC